jgi:hypothetical protein
MVSLTGIGASGPPINSDVERSRPAIQPQPLFPMSASLPVAAPGPLVCIQRCRRAERRRQEGAYGRAPARSLLGPIGARAIRKSRSRPQACSLSGRPHPGSHDARGHVNHRSDWFATETDKIAPGSGERTSPPHVMRCSGRREPERLVWMCCFRTNRLRLIPHGAVQENSWPRPRHGSWGCRTRSIS